MSNKSTFLSILISISILFSMSLTAQDATIVEDILQIPYAGDAPTIDGDLDGVWDAVTATQLRKYEGGPADSAGVFSNHYTTCRVMWDEDNLYIFFQVVDQELDGSDKASPWLNDAVELFIDGGNEKASSYDDNDIQWRYIYGEVVGDTSNASNGPGNFVFKDTENGYNVEIAISADSLANYFALEADTEIGWEVSNADRDEGDRDNVLHWWTTDGNTWQYPNLFGTALLVEREVTEVINIQYAEDGAPEIDGMMEEGEGWEIADEISMEKFEGTTRPDTLLTTWKTHFSSAWFMWDEDNFYYFVKVDDDELDGSDKASPWLNDAIELFFDGGNEKASSYDDNDIQWRWIYGETYGDTSNAGNGPGEFVTVATDMGWNIEGAIPKDSLANIMPLTNDHEFGFEISNANRDNGDRLDVRHWWTNDGNTWQFPNLFGTALLVNGPTVDVKEISTIASSYELSQNYPNPFNPTTSIKFSIPEAANVKLKVYNSLGAEVGTLVNGMKGQGSYEVSFDASQLSSGVYFYTLDAGSFKSTKKMILLK